MTTTLGGISKFEQCVLKISLINICDRKSYVGDRMRQQYNQWKGETDETVGNPWSDIHQFTIYLPHPSLERESITLESGLTQGYNIEVKPVESLNQLPYRIPRGAHFVEIARQKEPDSSFKMVGTGIFVRPLGILCLDLTVDFEEEYQSMTIEHPTIRNYPSDWQNKLKLFREGKIDSQELPQVVKYVDRAFNQDYQPPSWRDIYPAATEFAGF
jgi:hypothetical protein